jgi:hypothetical protein
MALPMANARSVLGFNPSSVPGLLYYWLSDDQARVANTERTGVGGGSLTLGAGTVSSASRPNGTYNPGIAAEAFNNSFIAITGQTSPGNNGVFRITANATNGTSLSWANAAGVAEAFVGSWHIFGTCDQLVERTAGKVFSLFNEVTPYQTHFRFSQQAVLPGKYVLNCSAPTSGSNLARMVLDDQALAGNLNGQVNFTWGVYVYAPNGWGSLDLIQGFHHVTEQSVADVTVGSFSKLYCMIDTAGPGPRNVVASTVPGTTDDMQSSIAAPSGGFQLLCCTYDYSTRTTDFHLDGVLAQSVTDSAGSAPSPSNLRYLSWGDRTQNTQVRTELWSRGGFLTTGKLSTEVQLQLKNWYANAA